MEKITLVFLSLIFLNDIKTLLAMAVLGSSVGIGGLEKLPISLLLSGF